jgi:hypothetical protein
MTTMQEPLQDAPGSSQGFEASLFISPSSTPFAMEQPSPPSTALSVNTQLRRCRTCNAEYNTKGSNMHRGFCGLGCKQQQPKRNRNCTHGTIRSRCKQCDGGSLCKHKLIRSNCKQCSPLLHEARRQVQSRRDEAGQNAVRTVLENRKPVAGVQLPPAGPQQQQDRAAASSPTC